MSWKLNLELYHENHEIVSPLKHYSCIFVHIIYIFSLYCSYVYSAEKLMWCFSGALVISASH